MDGVSYDRYLRFTWYERWVLHEELNDLIERVQAPTEKKLRRAGM